MLRFCAAAFATLAVDGASPRSNGTLSASSAKVVRKLRLYVGTSASMTAFLTLPTEQLGEVRTVRWHIGRSCHKTSPRLRGPAAWNYCTRKHFGTLVGHTRAKAYEIEGTKRSRARGVSGILLRLTHRLLATVTTANAHDPQASQLTKRVCHTGGHTGTVNGVSWHAESDSLFSCSDDQHLVHWSVSSCKVKSFPLSLSPHPLKRSKWKADRHSIHAVATIDASTVLSASSSIKWWNVETKTVVMASPEGGQHILISELHALRRGKVLMGVSSPAEAGKMAYLSAVTRSGSLHVFELQLNGRCKTPLQPKFTIQIASEAQNGRAPKPQPVPVLAAAFSQDDALVMCYNSFLRPSFERLSITSPELQAQTWLVRQVQPPVPCTVEDGVSLVKAASAAFEGGDTLAPRSPGAQRPRRPRSRLARSTQLPMEERLRASTRRPSRSRRATASEPPRADNLSQLLLQGLQSDDPKLLNSVLQRTDEMLIKNTVRRLPLSSILSLLKELHKRMHSRGSGARRRMRCFTPLLELLEARTEVFDKVCRLRGRVDLIMSQVAARHEDTKVSMEPLCVVQIGKMDFV
ncbi:hypothetical protein HPB48_016366 [Haemaphysalis longicornis]|uniref:Small-subunit processome Utp12 domain-containing protein n=1 Tax=Haemaphysalis longicornis TaxID=44386 RepID=A0A9J6GAR7_HAELO|nr:hypothetical protein HPB48_016366 [Haemaphysalis longicornis]